MRNEALVRSIRAAGVTYVALAGVVGVTPKTVSRWVASREAIPRAESRDLVARFLNVHPGDLWPIGRPAVGGPHTDTISTYSSYEQMPAEWLRDLVTEASESVEIIGYDEAHLWALPGFVELLARRAGEGVRVRVVLADPEGQAVEIGITGVGVDVARARARLAWLQVAALSTTPGVELLMHDTALGLSAMRVDDYLVVRSVLPGGAAPVMCLRGDGPLVDAYRVACEASVARALSYQPSEQRALDRRRSLTAVRVRQS